MKGAKNKETKKTGFNGRTEGRRRKYPLHHHHRHHHPQPPCPSPTATTSTNFTTTIHYHPQQLSSLSTNPLVSYSTIHIYTTSSSLKPPLHPPSSSTTHNLSSPCLPLPILPSILNLSYTSSSFSSSSTSSSPNHYLPTTPPMFSPPPPPPPPHSYRRLKLHDFSPARSKTKSQLPEAPVTLNAPQEEDDQVTPFFSQCCFY
ncbi:hypothetical protein E2C01_070280 [Portunus trituberculatus]|uniref:Uncharacterized protein n=1 Tax=Portunus trituberculatus TaxID=210409 RepID=A0A5B7I0W1_PORTR|nr:hypothetical protein [Portunus trituberculatus]